MIDRGQKVTTWPTPFWRKLTASGQDRTCRHSCRRLEVATRKLASPSDVNDDVNGQVTLGAQVQLYKPEADWGPEELPSLATR